MSIFTNMFKKINHGYFYVVDINTLKQYLQTELNYSLSNNLEASANINLYLNNIKYHLQIWNYSASSFEKEKGLIIYFNDFEYPNLEELYQAQFQNLPEYFVIELIDFDSELLNKYQKEHPQLKVEDYLKIN